MKKTKIRYWFWLAVMMAALTACSSKENDILPFSAILPGVTAAQAQAAESGESVSDNTFVIKKEYQGFTLYATVDDSRPGNGLIWNCYEEEKDLDDLVKDVKKYCNKAHQLVEEGERDGTSYALWKTGDYSIFLQDFERNGQRQVDISVLK